MGATHFTRPAECSGCAELARAANSRGRSVDPHPPAVGTQRTTAPRVSTARTNSNHSNLLGSSCLHPRAPRWRNRDARQFWKLCPVRALSRAGRTLIDTLTRQCCQCSGTQPLFSLIKRIRCLLANWRPATHGMPHSSVVLLKYLSARRRSRFPSCHQTSEAPQLPDDPLAWLSVLNHRGSCVPSMVHGVSRKECWILK